MKLSKNVAFQPRLLALAIMSATAAGAVVAATPDEDEGVLLEEVVVTGIRGSLEKALEMKREANQILDAVSAEDIGKFPDANVAEALQRVPGVQISRGTDTAAGSSDGGEEGTTVSIRGMRSSLNKTTVNGNSIASSNGSRGFSFSTVAPEMVKRLEVFKTPSAMQDEGAVGGTVNMVTRTPLDIGKFKAMGSVKVIDDNLADEINNRYSGLLSNVFFDGRLGLLVAATQSDETVRNDGIETFGWRNSHGGNSGLIARDTRMVHREVDKEKTSISGAVEFSPNEDWNFRLDVIDSKMEQHNVQSNYQIRVGDNSNLNQSIVNENGTAVFVDASPRNGNQRSHRIVGFDRIDTTKTQNYTFNTEWSQDDFKVVGKVGRTEGSFVRNPSLFAVFGASGDLSYDIRNSYFPVITSSATDVQNPDPAAFRLMNASRAFNTNSDEESFAQLDFNYFIDGSLFTTLRTGIKYRDRDLEFTKKIDALTPAERAGVNLGDYYKEHPAAGDFASDLSDTPLPLNWPYPDTQALLAGPLSFSDVLADPVRRDSDLPANYTINEETTALYVQGDFEGENFRGNIGVRYVETKQDNTGFDNQGNTALANRTYDNVLPSFNLTYNLQEDLLVRFAVAQVMARPELKDLTSGITFNLGAGTAKFGNPNLDPFEATQGDLSLEWYFDEGAAASIGLFVKDIDSFVTQVQSSEVIPAQDPVRVFTVNRPVNGGGGKITGLEMTYQQNFTFLPAPFDGLGVATNLTMVESSTDLEDQNGNELPLPGMSETAYNVVGFWENDTVSARLAYTYRDEFVVFPASLGGQAVWRKDYGQLDASVSYNITDKISLRLEGTNLTEEKQEDYAGVEERFISWRDNGRRFALTLRAKY